MTAESESTRQYTDREVQLILQSAVDLQKRADRASDSSGRMSLAQLEQVGREAGLDPELIRRAAAQLDAARGSAQKHPFLGGPTQIVLERVVEVVVDASQFDQFLEVSRAVTREVGEVSAVGRQFGWKGRLDGSKAEVSIAVGDRSITLRVKVDLDDVAVGHFMLKGMLFGIGGGLAGSAAAAAILGLGPSGLGVGAVIMGFGFLWARDGQRRAADRYRMLAGELIDALANRALAIARTKPA
jgi:hypothetical protein